jgi:tetratricopeptide (TPR) repeat protein
MIANTLLIMPKAMKKSLTAFIYFVLAASTLLVFWQVRNFDFTNYDDNLYVYENSHVLNGLTADNIFWAFTTGHTGYWHPLTWLSLMLDCQLFGPNPGRIHLVSLFLHVVNTLLLFAVLRKMTGALWPSAFVAALFAVHPMHVESVAWIAERKDVLSTLFLLLTLAAYVGYVRGGGLFRYLLTVLLFILGLLAKPMLVTLPFVLLLLDYWPLKRFSIADCQLPIEKNPKSKIQNLKFTQSFWRLIIEKVPFFALSMVSSVITFIVQKVSGAVININALPLQDRVANAIVSYMRYIGKMVWPQNLAVFYPFDIGNFTYLQITLCAILLLVISIFVIGFGRKQKYLLVGWFWFIGTLIPVIGLVQVGAQALANRYTYISYIGLFIMIAWGLPELLSKWPQRKIALGLSMVIVLTILGICAHQQVSYWNNGTSLFTHVIKVTQDNYFAHYGLGISYKNLGCHQDAIESYKQAIRINPDYDEAYNDLGISYFILGRYQDAIEAYKQAIRINPDLAKAYNNLGNACLFLERYQDAIESYKQAIGIKPDLAEAYYNLGAAYLKLGRYQNAIEAYKQAIRIKPDLAEAHYNLGKALVAQGQIYEALDQLRQAIRLRPDCPDFMNDFAFLIITHPEIKNRDVNEAIGLARRACELTNYHNPAMLGTLAASYAAAARFPEAVDTARKAIAIADSANQPQIKNIIQHHLTFYTQGKPYIEPAAAPFSDAPKP